MRLHTLRLRLRRLWRRRSAQVEDLSQQAGEQIEENFLGRLGKFKTVWRLVLGWALLFVLISGTLIVQLSQLKKYYQVLAPVPGGIYSEGIEGSFTTANPLYAVNEVDTSVSRLVFASLLTYDQQNHLTGDLADRWTVNDSGTEYTVHLRPHLIWQDGQPLTADDVVFTYQTIQNPDAQSPLLSSWRGVKVVAKDSRTIVFTLPNPLSSFAYGLVNGIVPKHILEKVNVVDLRSISFNTSMPIGAGPFKWASLGVSGTDQNAEEQISLTPFQQYWAGAPKLSTFNVYAFADHDTMIRAYRSKAITAMVGLDNIPANVAHDSSTHVYDLPLTAGTYVFFKTSQPILKDVKVRQALIAAADRTAVIQQLGYAAIPVNEPLLKGQLGYDRTYAQVTNKPDQAKTLLDGDGWQMGPKGIRIKNGQPLTFTLAATNSTDYTRVASLLHDQWKAIGADVKIQLLQPAEFHGILPNHDYDAILYGISIGADPDVFVYWDSSQADVRSANRLNFSEYKSGAADVALEAGRTRVGDQLRTIKYKTFLQLWQQDAPALALYQPRLLYISHEHIYGLEESPINLDADRFNNVQNWMIHTGWINR